MSQWDRVTPEGRALGEQMARLAGKAFAKQLKQFPNMKGMCATCAFRAGTIPNGCPQTQMDAIKAIVEGVPFLCHHGKKDDAGNFKDLCAGWFAAYSETSTNGELPIKCPWPFSPPDPEASPET